MKSYICIIFTEKTAFQALYVILVFYPKYQKDCCEIWHMLAMDMKFSKKVSKLKMLSPKAGPLACLKQSNLCTIYFSIASQGIVICFDV